MEDFQKRLPGSRSSAIEGPNKTSPSASLFIGPNTPSSSSSLMLDARPAEFPTPTKSVVLPPGDQTMLSPTQSSGGHSSYAKPLEDLQVVHTLASHENPSLAKSSTQGEKKDVQRVLFAKESIHGKDRETLAESAHKDLHINTDTQGTGQDKNRDDLYNEDLQDNRSKRAKTQDAKVHGKSTGRRSSSGNQKS